MKQSKQLSSAWQKAAIIGSLWGAFEIVAGSFIHNLALPLIAGTALSFTGVVIMIAFQSQWKTNGVLWRSALVCAALKSISPSAVILTPMLGITLEGLLMESGVLLFGNNITGFMIGGGLAVLSVLAFKIVRLVLVYGQGLIDAYNSAYSMAAGQLGIKADGAWWPVIVIAIIYFFVGSIAAITGVIVGKKLNKTVFDFKEFESVIPNELETNQSNVLIIFAIPLLYLTLLIAFLSFQNQMNFYLSVSLALLFIGFCFAKYQKVRALLSKLGFWLPVFILSFIIPILSFKNVSDFQWLFDGSRIFFRATLVIVSFSVIGIELGSKNVRSYFVNGRFDPVYRATSLAFSTLPGYIDQLKGMKFADKRPEKFISHFLNEAITNNKKITKRVFPIFIITADRGSGKTTFLKELASILDIKEISYAGFYAEGTWDENKIRNTFTLTTLPNKENILLCDTTTENWPLHGRFRFNPEAIYKGESILNQAKKGSVLLIDEIGILELDGQVWAKSLSTMIEIDQNPIIFTVRRHFLKEVCGKWNIQHPIIFDATTDCPEDAVKMLEK